MKRKSLTLRVEEDFYYKLKIELAKERQTFQEYVMNLILKDRGIKKDEKKDI